MSRLSDIDTTARTHYRDTADLAQMVQEIRHLHNDVHQCGGFWWNPMGSPGASIARQEPCPTLKLIEDFEEVLG